jgi:hypothetical protein
VVSFGPAGLRPPGVAVVRSELAAEFQPGAAAAGAAAGAAAVVRSVDVEAIGCPWRVLVAVVGFQVCVAMSGLAVAAADGGWAWFVDAAVVAGVPGTLSVTARSEDGAGAALELDFGVPAIAVAAELALVAVAFAVAM